MIHELIDPKKKTNRSVPSKNAKHFQEPKTTSEEINFEASDSENKESTSTIFIPPWLRNSLGLNQRHNLSHTSPDVKSSKLVQRGKEASQNEFESLKRNIVEQDCCKKVTDHFESLSRECPQEAYTTQGSDDVEVPDNKNEPISFYWDVKRKKSESECSANAESKPLKKADSKMINTDVFTLADIEKLKEEDKRRLKFMKQKHKLRKRIMCETKQSDLDKREMDFLLEMKAREALDNYMKGDLSTVSSEMRHFEEKLLLLRAKSHELSNSKLNQQESNIQNESVEQLERVFEDVKDVNVRVLRNADFLSTHPDRKRDEKEEKGREADQKCSEEGKSRTEKDSLLSTDDENDIKRFSDFLSKNKNLDEKRKCLEEVRNYFERKRRTRLTKQRFMEEGKSKTSSETYRKEENPKEKMKSRDIYRGRRSKFALCNEEVVEKAVDEALQKFIELYHCRVSPSVMGNMKKNILQAIATDSLDGNFSKLRESVPLTLEGKKINLNLLNLTNKEGEKLESQSLAETQIMEVPIQERPLQKEISKKNGKNENICEHVSAFPSDPDFMENEKLKRLKKEFDLFLHSIRTHIDVTNLKLQSIILEKDEHATSNRNVQFVYNFTKKALEPQKSVNDYWHSLKEVLESKNRKDIETQTTEIETPKRNVKVQALDLKTSCEQGLQTEDKICAIQYTQTDGEGTIMREIKELKTYDVNPGLYRMVKSKEAGKFYLYPENLEDGKQEVCANSNPSIVKDKKSNKKRNLVDVLSKERTRERQVYFKEREKGKQKKSKRAPVFTIAHVKKRKKGELGENSLSCLYFRNVQQKSSDSITSKKDMSLTDENLTGRLDVGEDLRPRASKEEHLGCFWFWNGEKISPGCDLKTHVENLLKEKLTQITNFGGNQNEPATKNENERGSTSKVSDKYLDVRNANAILCFDNTKNAPKESTLMCTENESSDEKKKKLEAEKKKEENEEVNEASMSVSTKSMKNVGTQNSQMKLLSFNLPKNKSQSRLASAVRRKCTKRNIVVRHSHGKMVNIRKAEDLLRAVEEIKRMKFEIENSKKQNSSDSESLLDSSLSMSVSKHAVEDPLSVVLGLKDGHEVEEISNSDIKNRLKRLISLVDQEVQTNDLFNVEDAISVESQAPEHTADAQKHLNLVGRILSRVNQKERESLWNDVRDFIKTKIGKDINDEGTREVCIEIEQDMPKIDQGKTKHSITAKGHYMKNEGDVEVEIDLTLDDLAKLLRQRQKKIRRRNLYPSRKTKNFLSGSSGQSDITRDDLRWYQKYLHRFAALGENLTQEKESKTFRKNKGN